MILTGFFRCCFSRLAFCLSAGKATLLILRLLRPERGSLKNPPQNVDPESGALFGDLSQLKSIFSNHTSFIRRSVDWQGSPKSGTDG